MPGLSCSIQGLQVAACGVSSDPGVNPGPPELGAWSLSHWTTTDAPCPGPCDGAFSVSLMGQGVPNTWSNILGGSVWVLLDLLTSEWRFPGGSDGKESACNVGDLGSIPGSGRSPGEGSGYPLQYSCLRSPVYRGAWRATVHGVAKSWTQRKQLSTAQHLNENTEESRLPSSKELKVCLPAELGPQSFPAFGLKLKHQLFLGLEPAGS